MEEEKRRGGWIGLELDGGAEEKRRGERRWRLKKWRMTSLNGRRRCEMEIFGGRIRRSITFGYTVDYLSTTTYYTFPATMTMCTLIDLVSTTTLRYPTTTTTTF